MTTATRESTGIKFWGLLVGAVVLAMLAAASVWDTGPLEGLFKGPNERKVLVSAIWTPSPRPNTDDVFIEIRIAGTVDSTLRNTAPYVTPYIVTKGQRIDVKVEIRRGAAADLLGCSIAVEGVEVVNHHRKNVGAGDPIECWAIA